MKTAVSVLADLLIGWFLGCVLMVLVYSLSLAFLLNIAATRKDAQADAFFIGLACIPVAMGLKLFHGWRKRRKLQ